MQKIFKISLFIACIVLFLAFVVQFLYNLDKDSKNQLAFKLKDTTIKNLENTINQLEEKNSQLEEENEQSKKNISQLKDDLKLKNHLDEREANIYNYYYWIRESKWNKVTLTNRSGKTIDITDNEIFKKLLYLSYLEFEYQFMPSVPIMTTVYTYTFYFDNEVKEITLSHRGLIRAYNMIEFGEICESMTLYDIAEALLPIEDSFKKINYNAKQILLDSKVYKTIIKSASTTYSKNAHTKYIILDWIPQYMKQCKEFPSDIGTPTYEFVAYYRGEEAHFKIYEYNDTFGYFMELSYKNESIIYERNNVTTDEEFSLMHLLQHSII